MRGVDGVDKSKSKRHGEERWWFGDKECRRRGAGGKVGQGGCRSTGAPFLLLLCQCSAARCWSTVRDGKSGRVHASDSKAATGIARLEARPDRL